MHVVLYIITLLCFGLPLFGIILNVIEGNGINFGGIIGFGVFCLIGFYLLRISLWNTYGEEIIQFNKNEIIYLANYKWFKDGEKTIEKNEVIYTIKPVGYEVENKGILVISNGKSEIESVVKIPKDQLEKLITIIQKDFL